MVTPTQTPSEIRKVLVDKIVPSPWQPRKTFDEGELKELGKSIKQNGGLIQPIVVRVLSIEEGTFQLIAGERRLRAHKVIKWDEIDAIIKDVPDEVAHSMVLVENLQRKDLTLMEEAHGIKELVDLNNGDLKPVMKSLGKGETYIKDRLTLVSLPEKVQALIEAGKLNMAQAKVVAEVKGGEEEQIKAAELGVKLQLDANALRGRLQRKTRNANTTAGERGNTVTYDMLQRLLVLIYDKVADFDYDMLRDTSKRGILLKQSRLLQNKLTEAISRLESEPVPEEKKE